MVRTDPQGHAINRLEGRAMEHFPDTDSYDITEPRAIGHQPDSPITVGTARTGTLDQQLDVRSEQLTIEPNQDLVHTDRPALVINGHSTMRGQGMRYDNRTRQLTVEAASDVKISGEDQAARKSGPKKATQP
jgi:lipopolysaccharide export system protein LptC